jgi:hypothetical protein
MDKPTDLGMSGSHFWDRITDPDLNLVLRPDEWPLLVEACRCLDLMDTLRAAFAVNPEYIVRGSQNQPTINPILKHIDATVARYQSLTKQLQVPDLDDARARQRAEQTSADMRRLGNLSWAARKGSTG